MGSVLLGIEAASALTDLIAHYAQMQQQVNAALTAAQANGGKLTDTQISAIQKIRAEAVAANDAALKAQQKA